MACPILPLPTVILAILAVSGCHMAKFAYILR
jgi:hypothetical protein